ncbi:E3 ubiquitin-protein ligase SINA-like 10 [Curcuma longa]|uniref:E3 ubiquitin-protein ligase SINA-like 10 n=1 Tax=Curcuma longa TaxID=136217 RepID=UPI003D9EB3F8
MEAKEEAAEWTTARLKLHILRCDLCNGRLTPPVYQNEQGFAACHKCQKTLTPSSSSTPGYIRNHALEKVIESLSIPCSHSAHGCNEYLPYLGSSIANHEKDCSYAPRRRCFIKKCAFEAPNGALVQHLTAEHRIKIHYFSYEVPLRVSIDPDEPLLVLRASDDGVDFVLFNSVDKCSEYHNFSVVCCSQSRPSKKIFSKLALADEGIEIWLKIPVEQWDGLFCTTAFLVVPPYFYGPDGKIDLKVSMHVED